MSDLEPKPTPDPNEEKPLTVAQISSEIQRNLERTFGRVFVIGEVSQPNYHSGGSVYFNLKDRSATIAAVIFKVAEKNLPFKLEHGQQVRVRGWLTTYPARGHYQIKVDQIEPAGAGNLHQQMERLRRQLRDEGLFDPARKKPLPQLPRKVGVVTSRDGAAVHDFISVIKRRFPNIHLLIVPVTVEGPNAAREIANAVRLLNRGSTIDVIVVTRGGGSFESLFPFSMEPVVRAIAESRIPVISAVGHQTDQPLCELAADRVAATPSMAAEVIVGRKDELEAALEGRRKDLVRVLRRSFLERKNDFDRLRLHPVFREPGHLVRRHRNVLESHRAILRSTLQDQAAQTRLALRDQQHALARLSTGAVHQARQRLDETTTRHLHSLQNDLSERRAQLERLQAQLRALSPFAVLERGFSITRRPDGTVVRAASELKKGETIVTKLAEGEVESSVEDVRKESSR